MSDLASFSQADVEAVYGQMPCCVHTNRCNSFDPIDLHHVLSRGGKHNRKTMSSVLNCVPLSRSIHSGGLRDQPDQAWVYLRIAFEKYSYALGRGLEIKKKDRDFMEYANNWCLQKNLPLIYT